MPETDAQRAALGWPPRPRNDEMSVVRRYFPQFARTAKAKIRNAIPGVAHGRTRAPRPRSVARRTSRVAARGQPEPHEPEPPLAAAPVALTGGGR